MEVLLLEVNFNVFAVTFAAAMAFTATLVKFASLCRNMMRFCLRFNKWKHLRSQHRGGGGGRCPVPSTWLTTLAYFGGCKVSADIVWHNVPIYVLSVRVFVLFCFA